MAGLNKYQAYPEYRDSGVEWLGEIPSHWRVSKPRYIFNFGKGLTITKENLQDDGIPCINYGEIHSKYGFEVSPKIHPLKCVDEKYLKVNSGSLLLKGDIIFADTSEDVDGSGNFSQLISDNIIFAGYHTIIAKPLNRKNWRFYAYLLDCKELRTQVRHAVKGVKVFSITQAILRSLSVWLPTDDEQSKIVYFLDHETAKIDNLIEKQQQLIELLKEKRQAVISHAVTKGLNPDVPMKDSGVEWLGEIPNNWITIKLKFITTLKSEKIVLPHARYVGLENISSGDGNFIVTTDITPESTSLLFEKDDILFGKLRPYLAKAWLATFSGVCSSEFLVLKVEKLNSKYLNYFILSQTFIKQVDSSTYGTKMPRANWEDIGQLPIPLCSYEESKKIAMYLDKFTANLDILKEQQLRQIELLKERRTALISAAVTGKIDLRNWTTPIPEAETPMEVSA